MAINSLELEKHVLGGFLKFPELFGEIDAILKEEDFYNNLHKTIFRIIRGLGRENKAYDKITLAEKVKNLGISFEDNVDPFIYIDSLSYTTINQAVFFESCKELTKIRVRRELEEIGHKIAAAQKSNFDKSFDQIIAETDKIYDEKILSYYIENVPSNIFATAENLIEERGNNPVEEVGIKTPFTKFNLLYGGLKPKNLYAFVSRAGQGKSTLLFNIGFKSALATNFKTRFLLLDTEMETEDIIFRAIASITGVNMWQLESGNWRKNKNHCEKIREAFKKIKDYRVDHIKVGNIPIEEVCSIVKRWYYINVGRNSVDRAIIAYDYLKLTGEKISEAWKEYQVLGQKVDRLKKLAEELDCPILTSTQLNRLGENQNRKRGNFFDDSSAIAMTDRISWFGTYVGIFRRKTEDEIQLDGKDFGTHKLITTKSRFQGRDAEGHFNLVARKLHDDEVRWEQNYINFDVINFQVTEKGTLKDILNVTQDDGSITDGGINGNP